MKKQLSKSEVKDINEKLQKLGLQDFISKKDRAEIEEDDKDWASCYASLEG